MDASMFTDMAKKTTAKWTKQRKAEERSASAELNRYYALTSFARDTIKDAAYEYMEKAYLKVSDNGRLPALARQIMYASRAYILENSDCDSLDGDYFRGLLKDYIADHPTKTADWNVAFDPRGNYKEPHSKYIVPIGTIAVKNYIERIEEKVAKRLENEANGLPPNNLLGKAPKIADASYPTLGHENRFSAILFIEKEGFMPLFQEVKLAERYDIAIMSTKGMSVIAARILADNLCESVPLLVVRDFDKAGFSIASTIQSDSKHYQFQNSIDVIDLGLRLEDAEKWDLESEDVYVRGRHSPAVKNLRANGATDEEIEYLIPEGGIDTWDKGTWGKRVELNAFTSSDLIEWLEEKLEENGIEKVVPDGDVLDEAYRRAYELRHYHDLIKINIDAAVGRANALEIPDDLKEQIRKVFEEEPEIPWDKAINHIVLKKSEEERSDFDEE